MELICLGFLGNLMTMQPVYHQDPTFTLDIILKLLLGNNLNIAEKIDNYITGFDLKKGEKYIIALLLLKKHTKIADKNI